MPETDLSDIAICLIGEPGSGKTKFLGSLPRPLYVVDADKGMRTLRGEKDITYDIFRDGPFGMDDKTGDDLYKWGSGWPALKNKLASFSKCCPYASVAIDTVTFAQQLAKNFARKRSPSKTQGMEAMEVYHWGDVGNQMVELLDLLITLPCIKVVTCHVKRDTNPLNQNIEFIPLIDGNMQGRIAGFFDEVYYTNRALSADKKHEVYTLQTRQSGMYKAARTRIGVEDGSPLEWQSIVKAVEPQPVKVRPVAAAKK
jgi:hypothetical protein